jgi:hypothetical protein
VAALEAFVALTRNGPELLIVEVARELDEMLLSAHVNFGDDSL